MARFSRLIKELRSSDGTPPAGSRAAGFLDWISGRRDIKVQNKVPAGGKEALLVAIAPFGFDVSASPTDADYVQVSMTAYSYEGWRNRLATKLPANNLGWKAPDATNRSASGANLKPALLKVRMTRAGATTDPDKVSGITGKPYKYTPSRSFSLPFGRSITETKDKSTNAPVTSIDDVDFEESVAMLMEQLQSTEITGLVDFNFVPEVIKIRTRSLQQYSAGAEISGVPVN